MWLINPFMNSQKCRDLFLSQRVWERQFALWGVLAVMLLGIALGFPQKQAWGGEKGAEFTEGASEGPSDSAAAPDSDLSGEDAWLLTGVLFDFALHEDQLFRAFVHQAFQESCAIEYADAMSRLQRSIVPISGYSAEELFVDLLKERDPLFLHAFETCKRTAAVLALTDAFPLRVPAFFHEETWVQCEALLRGFEDGAAFEIKEKALQTFFKKEIEESYSLAVITQRLKKEQELHSEELAAPAKVRKPRCEVTQCRKRIPASDANPFFCPDCQGNYCKDHRYANDHSCAGSALAHERRLDQLKQENPQILPEKLPDRL
jgi:hypothetical protein